MEKTEIIKFFTTLAGYVLVAVVWYWAGYYKKQIEFRNRPTMYIINDKPAIRVDPTGNIPEVTVYNLKLVNIVIKRTDGSSYRVSSPVHTELSQ